MAEPKTEFTAVGPTPPARREDDRAEAVSHPSYYGGRDNPYEAIKIIEHYGMGFHDGNALKYLVRWNKKHSTIEGRLEDLKKCRWYIDRLIQQVEEQGRAQHKQP